MEHNVYCPKKNESIFTATLGMIALAKKIGKPVSSNFNGIELVAYGHGRSETVRITDYYCRLYAQRTGADRYSVMPADADKKRVNALLGIIERIIAKHHLGENALDDDSFRLFELAKRVVFAKNETALLDALKALNEFGK